MRHMPVRRHPRRLSIHNTTAHKKKTETRCPCVYVCVCVWMRARKQAGRQAGKKVKQVNHPEGGHVHSSAPSGHCTIQSFFFFLFFLLFLRGEVHPRAQLRNIFNWWDGVGERYGGREVCRRPAIPKNGYLPHPVCTPPLPTPLHICYQRQRMLEMSKRSRLGMGSQVQTPAPPSPLSASICRSFFLVEKSFCPLFLSCIFPRSHVFFCIRYMSHLLLKGEGVLYLPSSVTMLTRSETGGG